MIKDFSELCETTKDSLHDYLDLMGVEPNQNGFFSCLNPAHDDGSPSMHVTPDGQRVLCFGCGAMYDTIDLAAVKHGYSTEGEDFAHALKAAADELDIKYDLKPPTAEEIRNATFYNAYANVAFAVASTSTDEKAYTKSTVKYIKEHGWDVKTLASLGVGALTSNVIRNLESLIPAGIEDPDEWLVKHDFRRSSRAPIFEKDRLIFTLYNEHGKPVGFTARHTAWTKDGDSPKYCNTSGGIVPIYDKGAQLYLYHLARKEIRTRSIEKLYVFEGQPDVVTAHHYGFKNCTALGTSSISDRQVYLLKKSGATKVVFCLDGDAAGRNGAMKLLTDKLKEFVGVRVYVKQMPENTDPDEFLREHGREEFHKLEEKLGIEWLLEYYRDQMEAEELAEFMVPMIASFSSAIERESLAKRVALITDLSTNTILDDINAIVHEKENTLKNRIREIGEDVHYQLQRNPERATQIMDAARQQIITIEAEHDTDHLSGDFFADSIIRFRDENELHGEEFPGFSMPMMPGFQEAFNNDWSSGKMICIGGDENTGKTSFSCFKMANLVIPEAENNLRGLYMTIDDSVQELYHKFICIFGKYYTRGYKSYHNGFDLEINHIVRPKYWSKVLRDVDPKLEEDMHYAYRVGYEKLLQLARQEKLIMIGVPNSRNLSDFRRAIKRLRDYYKDDNIYGYLDNIHKLPLPNGDARLGFKEISNDIKDMSVEFECALGGTLEYNTSRDNRGKDGRPTNNSLAESRAFRYDASALVHMYNKLHVKGEESEFYHDLKHPWYHTNLKAPVAEVIIGKNKISSDKMPHFFKFYPGSSWFEYEDRAEALAEAERKELLIKEKKAEAAAADATGDDMPVFDRTSFGRRDAISIA